MGKNIEIVSVALNAEEVAPEWIELVPAGTTVRGRDQRYWFNTDPRRILNAFRSHGRPVVLDWEHGSELNAGKGERAPAAGWIEELRLQGGAIWGRVGWTPKGKADVIERGYRYISPTFAIDPTTREIARLKSAALTHEPNLELRALNKMDGNTATALPKIARALSLEPDADEGTILAAIEKLLNRDIDPAMNFSQDNDTVVPRRDYELAIGQLNEFRERERDRLEGEIVETVDSVIAIGDPSFPPAKRDTYLAMCREEGGLERFREIMVPNPSRSLARNVVDGRALNSSRHSGTEEERAILEIMGVDPAKALD